MKRLTLIFTVMSFLVLSLNVFVDPANLLRTEHDDITVSDEQKIAELISKGHNVVVPREKIGFDERRSKIFLMEIGQPHIQSLVFGSSRIRYLSQRLFRESPHFVDAINAATLEDLLVFTFFREKNLSLPKKSLYIALDPWMIAKSNDYADWLKISMPDHFVSAVNHFNFTLPTKSQRRFLDLSVNRRGFFSVPMKIKPVSPGELKGFEAVMSGTVTVSGTFPILFNASISYGVYNWAWRVVLNDEVIDNGTYMDTLKGGISPHKTRKFITRKLALKKGDKVTLEMSHANNDGEIIAKGNQRYSAKNLSVLITCDDRKFQEYSYFQRINCYLPKRQELKSAFLIIKEIISPAYFQYSLKRVLFNYTKELKGPEIQVLIGKCEQKMSEISAGRAKYLFCANGGFDWPPEGSVDANEVKRIVRTVDDGLVPLKVVDKNALSLLEQLTKYFLNKGVEVKYLLIPVHPYSYEKWKSENDSRGFLTAEKSYRNFAARIDVPIFGSYNPKTFGCGNDDFRDWVHPLPSCIRKISIAAQKGL